MRSTSGAILGLVMLASSVAASCGAPEREAKRQTTQRFDRRGVALQPVETTATRPNLIVVLIDTLRADAVTKSDGFAGAMPYFHELSKQGVSFDRAFAPSAWTAPSLASLLTGLLPRQHGCLETGQTPRLPSVVATFAEILSNTYQYETAVFSDQKAFRLQPWSIFQGFARGSRTGGFAASSMRAMERGYGFPVTDEVLDDWLGDRDASRPFCLLLHTFDAHDPYGPDNRPDRGADVAKAKAGLKRAVKAYPVDDVLGAREFTRLFLTTRVGRDKLFRIHGRRFPQTVAQYMVSGFDAPADAAFAREMHAEYERGARWVDGGLKSTVEALRKRGLLENTLLVVTSDHGEAFGEHGTLGHGHSLHAEVTHVPLVMMGPGPFAEPKRIATTVSLLDVFPTFFDWADLRLPKDIAGRSLLAPMQGEPSERIATSETIVTEHMAGPGARALWLSRRSDEWSFLIEYDITAGTVTERLFRADDVEELHDHAIDGRVLRADVSDAFCSAIDDAREAIWTEVESAQERAGTVYGAGIGSIESERPGPCAPAR